MAYNGKTNWQNNEIVEAVDMNRIEQGISDTDVGLGNVQVEVTAHKAEKVHQYEEGTWTPTLNRSDMEFVERKGIYKRIGNMIYISGYIHLLNMGVGSNAPILSGLPYPISSENLNTARVAACENMELPTDSHLIVELSSNSSYLRLKYTINHKASTSITPAHLLDNTKISFELEYLV